MNRIFSVLDNNGRFYIVRHGKTDKAQPDSDRRLTEEGRECAKKAGDWIKAEGRTIKAVVVSDALRCYETARVAFDVPGDFDQGIKSLYPFSPMARGTEVLNAQFSKHGNGNLKAYFGEEGCEDAATEYATTALEEIDWHIPLTSNAGDIIVVCHAVVSVMVALEVAKALELPADEIEKLVTLTLNEGDVIEVSTAGVRHIANADMPEAIQTQSAPSAAA